MSHKYRYRDNAGSTYHSEKRFKQHIHKIGRITEIHGYRYRGRYGAIHEGVMFKGTRGTARFNGFCWGYSGTGPRGLKSTLMELGLSETEAEQVAFRSMRKQTIGVDWVVRLRTVPDLIYPGEQLRLFAS